MRWKAEALEPSHINEAENREREDKRRKALRKGKDGAEQGRTG